MDIELIGDEDPAIVWGGRDGPRDMGHEVLFRARGPKAGSELLAGGDFAVGNQALRTVPHVFVFLPFGLARLAGAAGVHRLCRRSAFQCLNPSLFVGAHQMNALGLQRRSLLVQLADRCDLRPKLFCVSVWGVEPVLNPMRFEIDLILKNARHLTGRCVRRGCV